MPPKTTSARIVLKGEFLQSERKAGAIIQPGMLLAVDGAGDWIPNGTAADVDAPRIFARERDLFGKDRTEQIPIGDNVLGAEPVQGAQVQGLIEDLSNLADGAPVESAGSGELQAHTTGRIIGFVDGAINNTSGAAVHHPVTIA